jgi:predicted nicotinamide N-methyase
VLDHPALVRGRRVLDIGAGSGLVGLAAVKAGAAEVLAADIDAFACAAIRLNAAANACALAVTQDDLIGRTGDWDVILVGDLFYERPLAERLLAWLEPLGAEALLGDPGRNYFPKANVEKLGGYSVQTTRDLEDREIRETGVYRLSFKG